MDQTTRLTPGVSPSLVSQEHIAPWSKVSFAPPEPWVEEDGYDTTVRGKEGDHLTHLLWARQLRAGTGQSFHSTAIRLETSLAVQHQSQWSVQLDPRTQTLTVHWLRVVRDGRRIDHLQRERMRLIQRETQLERLIIDGIWTLIAVLDDVRPGDVLEAAFTYETTHPIRPKATEAFFIVPPQMTVGCYRLGVVSDASTAALTWKASSDAPQRREDILPDGRRRWIWEGSQLTPREPEPNQPGSCLDYTWVQISDLAHWRDLAIRTSEVWAGVGDANGLETIPAFARPEQVNEAAVTRLIQHVQDDFRYLSMNLELGGWIPSPPLLVAQRRYGDCKDLAWLTAAVLRSWGLAARPVLVETGLREQIVSLLPMTLLFNHCVVEVEVAGKTRWFDLTEQSQGGSFSTQAIAWFGHGLIIDPRSEGLSKQPGERSGGTYELRETLLVATRRGVASLAEQRIRAEGLQADNLRHLRKHLGADEFIKDREQQAQRRYGKARRTGTLQWRDDRQKNVCELVETFAIKDVVHPDESGRRASFEVPANLALQTLVIPDDKPRRTPWAMPFPLEVRHEITVKAGGMTTGNRRRRYWAETYFSASLDEPKIQGAWTKTVQFKVNAPEIPADQLKDYRKQLEKFLMETGWQLFLPWGQPRGRRGNGFGELPRTEEERMSYVPPTPMKEASRPPMPEVTADDVKLTSGERRQGHRRSSHPEPAVANLPSWLWRIVGLALVLLILWFRFFRVITPPEN